MTTFSSISHPYVCGLNHYWIGTHIDEGTPCVCGLTTYQSQLTQVLQVLDTYYGDTPTEVIKKLEAILGKERHEIFTDGDAVLHNNIPNSNMAVSAISDTPAGKDHDR